MRHYSDGGYGNERCWRGNFPPLLPPDDAAEQAIRSTEGYICGSPRTYKLSNTIFEIKMTLKKSILITHTRIS